MTKNKSAYSFVFGQATDIGLVRSDNEDYFGNFDTANGYVFVICDGIGGHAGGKKASRLAVETIEKKLRHEVFDSPYSALNYSFLHANDAILAHASYDKKYIGMGTTCSAVLIKDNFIYYAHVGDSRIYHYANNCLSRLTKDHSLVQSLVDLGEITEEEANSHPRKNEITQALGIHGMQAPTLSEVPQPIENDHILLLCTDGLTGLIRDLQIQETLESNLSIQDKATKLIKLALKAGGYDNITVQLIQFYKKSSEV